MRPTSRLRGVLISVLGYAVGPLAGFLTAPILAHGLGVTGRGETGAAVAPLILGMAVFTMGLPEAATYFVARRPEALRRIIGWGTLLVLPSAVVGIGLFLALGPFFAGDSQSILGVMALCTLMILPALLVGVLRGAAIGLERWTLIAAERTLGSVGKLVLIAGLSLTGHLTVFSASVTLGATSFGAGLIYLALLRPAPERPEPQDPDPRAVTARSMLAYGARQWFGSLAGVLLARLDQLLINPLAGAWELGLYVVAVSLADLVLVVNNALREVVFSMESKGPRGERIATAARISTAAALVTGAGIVILGIWMIPVLFGPGFETAWPVTAILVLGAVLGNPGSLAGTGLAAAGRPELRSWSLVAGALVNVVLVLVLVPPFGAVGAAFATMGGSVTAASGNLLFTTRLLGTRPADFLVWRASDVALLCSQVQRILRRG